MIVEVVNKLGIFSGEPKYNPPIATHVSISTHAEYDKLVGLVVIPAKPFF